MLIRANSKQFLKQINNNNSFSRKLSSVTAKSFQQEEENYFKNAGKDYQYLQRSELPTMYFQRSLPRLAIPKLEQTLERYSNAVKPLLKNDVELQELQKELEDFQYVGAQLHKELLQQDANNKHTSYISQPWFDMYLSDRAALPLNYNPVLVMNNETRLEYSDQLVRAGNLIISSLRFWQTLKSNLLEPEVFHLDPKRSDTKFFRNLVRLMPPFATYLAYTMKAYPLDMSQYMQLFGTTRIPREHKDVLSLNPDSRHILIMRRGNFYTMNVLNEETLEIEPPAVIYARLLAIVEADEGRTPASVPVGVMTTCERDTWARTRTELLKNPHNKDLLEQQVDKALFCVSLDTENEPDYNDNTAVEIYKNLLAGNSRNRWFDKSISLLVSKNGTAAINFEHSWGDGVAVLRYFNEIYKDTMERPILSKHIDIESLPKDKNINILEFKDLQGSEVEVAVKTAEAQHNEKLLSLNMYLLRYPHLHRQLCKEFDVSPDAVMQLAFQLAYYKGWNGFVGSYESCSTAAFRHGRTETLRPCTLAAKDFCVSVQQPESKRASETELSQLLKKCSEVHTKLLREAAMGQGFDRHLFALKNVAQRAQLDLPQLFKSEGYKRINHNIISTSTLSSPALLAGGFGPVVPDGLGIGYSIRSNECGAIVSSYQGKRDGKLFVDKLEESFEQIQKLMRV